MDLSWDLFELWSYDEYLDIFYDRKSAEKELKRLVSEGVYETKDLWIRHIQG